MNWWHAYTIIIITAVVIGLFLTPLCQFLAKKFDFMDRPNSQGHKGHQKATPLLGGLAIFTTWVLTITIGLLTIKYINPREFGIPIIVKNIPGAFTVTPQIIVIIVAAFLAMLLGLIDDKWAMSAKLKLVGQITISVIVVLWGGVHLTFFIPNPIISGIITVFWIVLIINAINFFDNMDGLAAGVATIALAFFTLAATVNQQYFVASLGAAATGSALAFWFFNHNPASIFMGDSGSHFLGYILAILSIKVTYYQPNISSTHFPILFPLFILAIPLFDTLAVVVIRLYKKQPIYVGDHNHISHRFLHMGMSRKSAVFMVHLLSLIISLSVFPMLWGDERTIIISLIQAGTILILISTLQYSVITQKTTTD